MIYTVEMDVTKKETEYVARLAARAQTLRNRLVTTQLRDHQEITKELHALEWAVSALATPPEEVHIKTRLAGLKRMIQSAEQDAAIGPVEDREFHRGEVKGLKAARLLFGIRDIPLPQEGDA